jgi:hypothetical protein
MSRAILDAPMIWPCEFRIGDTVIEIAILRLSLVMRVVSKWSTRFPARIRSMIRVSSSCSSGGMIVVMCLPMISAGS